MAVKRKRRERAVCLKGLPQGAFVRTGLTGKPCAYWIEKEGGHWNLLRSQWGKRGWQESVTLRHFPYPAQVVGTSSGDVRVEQIEVQMGVPRLEPITFINLDLKPTDTLSSEEAVSSFEI